MRITRPVIIKIVVLVLGFMFLITAGVLGMIPGYQYTDVVHAYVHAALGILALAASFNLAASKIYLKFTAIVLALIIITSYYSGGNFLHMHMNRWYDLAHSAIFVFTFYFGFLFKVK